MSFFPVSAWVWLLGITLSFAISCALCWFAVRYSNFLLDPLHMQADTGAPQALHQHPTPRVGGLGIFIAFMVALLVASEHLSYDLFIALASGLVVFAVGLKEDIYRNVTARARLLAAFLSAGIAIFMTSAVITGVGIRQVDWILKYPLVSVIVTLIWSAGTCHSFNLIDGINGLSSSYAITALSALSLIAATTGDSDILLTSCFLIAAIFGFLLFNWPQGRIFLGDAGAYAIGHTIAWLGIILVWRKPQVSGLAILLVLFWPVADTLFSIVRRKVLRRALDRPDRMHFHHMVVRVLARACSEHFPRSRLNPLATVVMIPMFATPAICGVIFWNQPNKALVLLLLFAFGFVSTYGLAVDALASRRVLRRSKLRRPASLGRTNDGELSPLSGVFVQGALAVKVKIQHSKTGNGWALRTEAANASGRRWDEIFATDKDAWVAFCETVRNEGMKAVGATPTSTAPGLSETSVREE